MYVPPCASTCPPGCWTPLFGESGLPRLPRGRARSRPRHPQPSTTCLTHPSPPGSPFLPGPSLCSLSVCVHFAWLSLSTSSCPNASPLGGEGLDRLYWPSYTGKSLRETRAVGFMARPFCRPELVQGINYRCEQHGGRPDLGYRRSASPGCNLPQPLKEEPDKQPSLAANPASS